jgi:phage shock protein PspC (stress-responsive transcriptional regulator)
MSENTQTYTPPEQPPVEPPPAVRPPLRRTRTDRKVAGVAGGLGAYLGIDPVILRILFVVLAIFGGSGLLLYLVAWLLIPEEGTEHSEVQKFVDRNGTAALVILGVVVAVLLIASSQALRWWGFGSGLWPLVVVAGVGLVVWYVLRQQGQSPTPPTPPAAPAAAVPPSEPTTYPTAPYAPASTTVTTPAVATPTVATPPRQGSPLGLITLSLATLTAGVLVALDLADAISLPSVVLFAVLTAIVGLGLVVGSVVGRARWLVVPGVLLALVTAATASVPTYASGQTGTTVWAPTSVASVATSYEWGAGDVTLDLTAVTPTGRTPVKAGLGAGTLTVVLPPTARALVNASVGVGKITMPDGSVSSGLGRHTEQTLLGPSGPTAPGTFVLDLNVGVGELKVRYATS